MRKDTTTLKQRLADAPLTREQRDAASDCAAMLGVAVCVPIGRNRFGLEGYISFGAPTALTWGEEVR